MRIQAYDIHPFTVTVTVATPRDEATPSVFFVAASIHEDFVARVRHLAREHKQVGESSLAYPASARLSNYLPAGYYALRELAPGGAPRDIDAEFLIEVTRLRFTGILVDLPGCMAAGVAGEARERHLEKAFKDLFKANDIPDEFIPGDSGVRDDNSTVIDIIAELGPAAGKHGYDIRPGS